MAFKLTKVIRYLLLFILASLLLSISALSVEETISPDPSIVEFITASEKQDSQKDDSITQTPRSAESASKNSYNSENDNVTKVKDVQDGLEQLTGEAKTVEEKEAKEESKEEREKIVPPLRYFGPMRTRNQHPLYLLFFNFSGDTAEPIPQSTSQLSTRILGANSIIKKTEGGAIVDLDLETWSVSFEYRHGLKNSEYSVLVPFRVHGHGIMDNIIDKWHRFFCLPRGNRPFYPEGDFRFYIKTQDGSTFNFPSDNFSLGDIELVWKQKLNASKKGGFAYRVGVKLPTGSEDDGIGSGAPDFGVGLLWDNFGNRFAYYANINLVILGKDGLSSLQNNNIISGMLGVEYTWRPSLTITGQIDYSQSPFSTKSPSADKDAVELILGFHRLYGEKFLLSGGFSEDIQTETAPDFTIIAELTWILY